MRTLIIIAMGLALLAVCVLVAGGEAVPAAALTV
jgi:hypothetical protein